MKASYIDHIEVNGVRVDLCPGINAIIGENGAGKSSLLTMLTDEHLPQYVKSFLTKRNTIQADKLLNGDRVVSIKQRQLEKSYSSDNGMFESSLYPEIDNTQFEARAKNWSKKVKERIESNIESATVLDKLKSTSFKLEPDLEKSTYYIQIDKPDDFTEGNNPHKAHIIKINNARAALISERSAGYYQ